MRNTNNNKDVNLKNPFEVKTPETLTPEDIASLFIDVFTDFPRLLAAEHTFLNGPRGSGKSMMLRYLEPKVQLAAHKVKKTSELKHFAIHMPIKKASYSLSELERLSGSPYNLLAEHFLITNAIKHILESLLDISSSCTKDLNEINDFAKKTHRLAKGSGSSFEIDVLDFTCPDKVIAEVLELFNHETMLAKVYIRNLAFEAVLSPYNEALFGYDDFFLPFIKLIKNLSCTPSGPIYLMVDDADNLTVRMQQILNGWVSYRSTNDICLKVSTQQRYKTWRTSQGILIESPHDFSEIDIRQVYTSKQSGHYYDRVLQIVSRRLELSGFTNIDPNIFFPTNSDQDIKLEKVKNKIKLKWENGEGVSSRKSDDVVRYAMSEYMKELALSKKKNTYSYAGFKSLVNLSSGMIRNFLEPAAIMYSELRALDTTSQIDTIPHDVQNSVLYNWSQEYMLNGFDKLEQDELYKQVPVDSQEAINIFSDSTKIEKIKNLITALGESFQQKLLSDDSERRYISFMLSSTPDAELTDILNTAVEWGYLQKSTIARKEGIGRNILYILNRRLAPYFKLDASGYAAHLSITPNMLLIAMSSPRAFVRERFKDRKGSIAPQPQQSLF
ncbi:MAG: hypothetical protein HRT55_07850 [Colwellia sp.]|uniref:ORC-CDC6 family AAA ATPase n=1 Tax=Alteromonadales TaxID=135622 RepID=UPI001D79C162|nr:MULTISPECIES: hypothetical protein [Alteromonadales]NQZ26212.1 hypothetical protein [Colwellia sp.]NRA80590.1 hypothetical protein [Pseudoalteromonas sp.]